MSYHIPIKVFISHSHHDRDLALDIQNTLHQNGASTFFDQDRIQVGDILSKEIQEGVKECDIFLLLWSKAAAKSKFVNDEISYASSFGKKIISYVLEKEALELKNYYKQFGEIVHIDKEDRYHGDALLLKAIFGDSFNPSDPNTLFPGLWEATVDGFGLVNASYEIELRSNGQISGNGKIEGMGAFGGLANSFGFGDFLNMKIPITGSWNYDRNTTTLTLNIASSGFGQKTNDTVKIQTTGHELGYVTGKDFSGKTWKLKKKNVEKKIDDLEKVLKDKDYMKSAIKVMGAHYQNRKLSDTELFITFFVAKELFFSDVIKLGKEGKYYKVDIGGSEVNAKRLIASNNERFRKLESSEVINGKLEKKIKSYKYQDNTWTLIP